jgi:Na+-transporting methylmalonyl-CoA/oxaloacetate decarboxylase gamma subunit
MDLAFGFTMMLLGMGITLITLFLLTLVIRLLNRIYPDKQQEKKDS